MQQKQSTDGSLVSRRDYVGQFEFVADTLERTLLPEGFITESDGTFHAFIPDHQGSIAGVYNSATNSLEQFTDYYPYGLPHASATAPGTNRRKYGAKELTTDLGLNLYDFAARFHNPAFPHFTTPDPLATNFNHVSIYSYCLSDPINLVDPTGMTVEASSLEEWNTIKKHILDRISKLSTTLELKKQTIRNMNLPSSQASAMLGSLPDQIRGLKTILRYMSRVEGSNQMYALNPMEDSVEGEMTLNGSTIIFRYNGIAQFIHELTHGYQFECGEIAFRLNDNGEICTILTDIDDEIQAYQNQFLYDPNSIPGIPKTISEINRNFIKSLLDQNGQQLYSSDSNAYTSEEKINIHTPILKIIQIYGFPSNIVTKSSLDKPIYMLEGIYSKKINSFN